VYVLMSALYALTSFCADHLILVTVAPSEAYPEPSGSTARKLAEQSRREINRTIAPSWRIPRFVVRIYSAAEALRCAIYQGSGRPIRLPAVLAEPILCDFARAPKALE